MSCSARQHRHRHAHATFRDRAPQTPTSRRHHAQHAGSCACSSQRQSAEPSGKRGQPSARGLATGEYANVVALLRHDLRLTGVAQSARAPRHPAPKRRRSTCVFTWAAMRDRGAPHSRRRDRGSRRGRSRSTRSAGVSTASSRLSMSSDMAEAIGPRANVLPARYRRRRRAARSGDRARRRSACPSNSVSTFSSPPSPGRAVDRSTVRGRRSRTFAAIRAAGMDRTGSAARRRVPRPVSVTEN